jgi:DNA-binding NarL/FixJ family response regulator
LSALRILLADDHEMVRRGLRSVLEGHEGWEVCGEVGDGRAAVDQAKALQPDIVILDITMPELNGLDAARQIREVAPKAEILILTMHSSERFVREVLAAGARGYVVKSDAGRVLLEAVETLRQHRPFFSAAISEIVLEAYLHPERGSGEAEGAQLTAREREALQLIAEGKSNKEVADVLGISVRTVETHRLHLMRKLKVRSVSELTRYAIRNRIIEA